MHEKNKILKTGNFLAEAQFPPEINSPEIFHRLIETDDLIIERITSNGQKTAEDEWLEENYNEWVLLLQGESIIKFLNGEYFKIKSGDYIYIPANTKHRVEYTSRNPECIWLAIHFK